MPRVEERKRERKKEREKEREFQLFVESFASEAVSRYKKRDCVINGVERWAKDATLLVCVHYLHSPVSASIFPPIHDNVNVVRTKVAGST